ncbi:MAG: sugar transferase [Pseudomonadota bacterium]
MYYHQNSTVFDAQAPGDAIRHSVAKFLSRIRTQLIGGLIAALAIPVAILVYTMDIKFGLPSFENSAVGAFCALLIGFMMFRKMTALPGASALMSVFPAFAMSYGMVLVLFLLLRLEYSRLLFSLSFVFVMGWFMLTLVLIARLRRPVMTLVTGGAATALRSIRTIRWIEVSQPEKLVRDQVLPLVVDLKNPSMPDTWERAIAEEAIAGRPIFNAKQIYESMTGRVQIEHLSENTFGHLSPDSIYAPAKRYLDAITAAIALVFLAPLLVVVAVLIRLDSKGPAIFYQTRMGFRGKPFTVYKFRSMRDRPVNADKHADMTLNDDNRITRIGRFIRKTRLDELPQLVNILKGEMSWIGPRPEAMRLSEWYEREIAFYRYRHIVRPGITGWAQVKQGHVVDVDDVRDKLEYDLYYIKHFSVWMDALIAMKTMQVILTGHGAK